jgi:X-X-X-Leu-X-X-Gly heptad repeat protein
MPKKGGNGHGNGSNPVVGGLQEVVAELRGFRADSNARFESVEQVLRGHAVQLGQLRDGLGQLRDGLGQVRDGLGQLRDETRAGFADVRQELEKVNGRLDGIRDLAGESYRALEKRVARLEERLP